jgi:hypothetical protein
MSAVTIEQVEPLFRQLSLEERVALVTRFITQSNLDLETLEDIEDILAAQEARAEGGTPISHEDFIAELKAEGRL